VQQLVERKTLGFCLQKIQADDLPFQMRWEAKSIVDEIGSVFSQPIAKGSMVAKKQGQFREKIVEAERIKPKLEVIEALFAQPYYLIGAGSECFAFISADKQVVIKFFKLDQARPVYFNKGLFSEDYSAYAGTLSNHPLTRLILPSPFHHWLRRFLGIREFRLQRTFSSIKLAYDELKEETGLIYLHLNPTRCFNKSLALYDANRIRHEVDLDSTRFFLQKRAVPLEEHFTALKKQEEQAQAKASIDSLLTLILNRCKKGFSDRDAFNKNFGFIGTEAIEIDSGSFHKNPRMQEPSLYKQELFYATLQLKNWLKKNYPEMLSYLEDRILEEVSG